MLWSTQIILVSVKALLSLGYENNIGTGRYEIHSPTQADSEFSSESESKLGPILIANDKNLCFRFLIKINDAGLKSWYQDPGINNNHFSTVANMIYVWSTF